MRLVSKLKGQRSWLATGRSPLSKAAWPMRKGRVISQRALLQEFLLYQESFSRRGEHYPAAILFGELLQK